MNAPIIELRDVAFRYPTASSYALHEVQLALGPGEIVGIVGPSGAGKSTLARLIAGLQRPTAGQVLADGASLWTNGRMPRWPRPGWAGAVFQDPGGSLDPTWTVRRILAEPFHAKGAPRSTREERLRASQSVLAEVGLDSVALRTLPAELSGGQRQRLALARCILGVPSLLVADEPTSALDVTSAAGVMHLLRRTADRGTAIVVVSHDRLMLTALADRVLECSGGRLREM